MCMFTRRIGSGFKAAWCICAEIRSAQMHRRGLARRYLMRAADAFQSKPAITMGRCPPPNHQRGLPRAHLNRTRSRASPVLSGAILAHSPGGSGAAVEPCAASAPRLYSQLHRRGRHHGIRCSALMPCSQSQQSPHAGASPPNRRRGLSRPHLNIGSRASPALPNVCRGGGVPARSP